ncbi:MAG: hypothetical protein JKY54_09865, partial [Flavobacteriales bacterium]|nr:hypothetical protein [Flavobacteriales bacterium]
MALTVKEYLKTGEVTSFDRQLDAYIMYGGYGGIWIPKKGITKQPRLFSVIQSDIDNAVDMGGAVLGLTAKLMDNKISIWTKRDVSS